MVPHIPERGYSFKGSGLYYFHDKGAMTSERVAWTQTRNLHTDDPEKAMKVMAWTDKNSDFLKERSGGAKTGAKQTKGNVYNPSLAWHPEEKPDKAAMIEAADDYMAHMGLAEHEYVIVAHTDTKHPHIHIIANLVHPETGKVADINNDQHRAQEWALAYQRERGQDYCPAREENAKKREQGEPTKYRDQKQDYRKAVTRAFMAADNGKAFIQALKAEGLTLCPARRSAGFVLVDERGNIQKLARQLEIEEKGKAKTAVINAKLADLDRAKLPDADKLAAERKAQLQQREAEKERAAQEMKQAYREAAGKKERLGERESQPEAPEMQQAYKQAAGQKERVGKPYSKAEQQRSANDNRLRAEEAQQRRNALQLRHLDQTRDLESRQDRDREKERRLLREQFGPDDRKARRELEAIRERQQQAGWRGWLYRHGSKAANDRVRAGEIKEGLKDSRQKQDWYMQGKERQWGYERTMLADKQADDRRRLEREIQQGMEPERTAQRERGAEEKREADYGRERERGGNGFER